MLLARGAGARVVARGSAARVIATGDGVGSCTGGKIID